jgi:hypothetical protein
MKVSILNDGIVAVLYPSGVFEVSNTDLTMSHPNPPNLQRFVDEFRARVRENKKVKECFSL